jgi:transaldolase
MQAFAEHGEVQRDKVSSTEADAQKTPDDLAGVDRLRRRGRREGLEKFDKSWFELVETVQTALEDAKQGKSSPGESADSDVTHDTVT